MSLELYDAALDGAPGRLHAEYDDGSAEALDIDRWVGPLDHADRALLSRISDSALDIGCGPGRLAAALSARGVDTLGVDVAPGAVRLARTRGATVVWSSVFDTVPQEGRWAHALLVDGNVGIGGDPLRLLRRVSALLRDGGVIHVEVGASGARHGPVQARLRASDGRVGSWFGWAHVALDRIGPLADLAGLDIVDRWEDSGRWFVELRS